MVTKSADLIASILALLGAIPKYFILDVDGVLNDGKFLYSKYGKQFKVFGPHDHDGLKFLSKHIKIEFVTADRKGFAISKKRIVDDMNFKLKLVSEQTRKEYLDKTYGIKNIKKWNKDNGVNRQYLKKLKMLRSSLFFLRNHLI